MLHESGGARGDLETVRTACGEGLEELAGCDDSSMLVAYVTGMPKSHDTQNEVN